MSCFAPGDIFAKLNPHVRHTLRCSTTPPPHTILYQMKWVITRDQITFDHKVPNGWILLYYEKCIERGLYEIRLLVEKSIPWLDVRTVVDGLMRVY